MIAAALAFAATLAGATTSGVDGCEKARAVLAGGVDDGDKIDPLIEALPLESVPVKVAARLALGAQGPGRAVELVAAAVADGCPPSSPTTIGAIDARAIAGEVVALEAGDARFVGVRKGDDLIDRLKHKAKLWLAHFFESSGMRAYASSARIIYLSLLGVAVVLVAVRVVRTLLRRKRRDAETIGATSAIERKRAREHAHWRAEAERALNAGDARGALRAGQAAILARVGELERGVVTPARTHREIVGRLSDNVAAVVRPVLAAFDAAFFAKDAGLDDAATFLRLVDDAAGALAARTGAP